MIKILRGDDSSAVQISPTVPAGIDLTGTKLVFECGGLVFNFADFQDGVSFTFPREWTSRQPVGRQLGRWSLVWPDGRKVTTTNTFPVYLTDVVSDVGGESRAEIHVPEGAPLEGLTLDPNASSASLLTILAAAFRRLGGTVAAPVIAVLIGFATLSAGAVQVSVKQPGEFRPNVDPVVTAVDLSGLTTADDLADATNKTLQAAKDYAESALGQGLADYFTATNIHGIAMSFTYTNIANGVWGLSPLITPLRPASRLTWSNDNGWQLGSEHGVVVAESSAWRWTPTIEMQNGNTVVTVLTRRIGIAPEVDFSTNNVDLVKTIEATAPAPGNYATVSNRAMTAVQPGDLGNMATQSDLASATNGLARASDVTAVRAVADAAATTNATQGAALSQLSQRTNDWDAAVQNASDALSYSRATYDFQRGNTNAWFSGTNFVFGADATNKTAFAFEPGMDLAIMPCSLALMELRDGTTQKVWDQRDWTVWYWNFKNAQYEATVAERLSAAAAFNATNYAPIAWGRRTSSGLANPDSKTLWVDAEKTVLAPGMAWESTVEVSGCAYWTIVGNATLSGNTNGVISILDFEGNPVFRIRKTASHLVALETGSEIYTSGWDAQGRITYTMRAFVHPVGLFSTVLDDSLFVEETNAGCPVDYEWETLEQPQLSENRPGVYRIRFLLKPGISSDGCFAKFKVEVQGETAVEFIAVQKITGGQVYDDGVHGDVKIRPVITSTAVGSVVTWEVAP